MHNYEISIKGRQVLNKQLNFTGRIMACYIPLGILVNLLLSYIYTNGFRSNSKSIIFHLLLGLIFIVFAMIIPLLKRISLWSKIIYQIRIEGNSVFLKFPSNFNIHHFHELVVEMGTFDISDGIRPQNKTILSKEDYAVLKLKNGKKAYLIKSFWDDNSEIYKKLNHEY